jgi:predicted PurR-regulated permease PerM
MGAGRSQREIYIGTGVALVFVAILFVASFWIARPFLAPLLWGVILAIATWPVFAWIRRKLRGRNTLAALAMTLLLAAVVLGPLAIAGAAITGNATTVAEWLRSAVSGGSEPPAFLHDIPYVGERLANAWSSLYVDGHLTDDARQLLSDAARWVLGVAAAIAGGVVEIALSVVCAFFFYRDGEAALRRLQDIMTRIAGARAPAYMQVAHGTLKGVVYGILGSSLAQSVLATIGFLLAGVPVPFALGIASGFLGIIPGGVALVWIPAAAWLFYTGETGWGIFIVAWGAVVVSNIDNVIRPLVISRGSALPLLIILIGILGGAMAFGFIGIFLGPTVLAVLYALMREWSPRDYAPAEDARPPAKP